jgi:hypothetical protein
VTRASDRINVAASLDANRLLSVWINARPGQWLRGADARIRVFRTVAAAQRAMREAGLIDSTDASRPGTGYIAEAPPTAPGA